MKRYKWTESQDKLLLKTLSSQSLPFDWRQIQTQLQQKGLLKTHKQIRLRWKNHLDPSLSHSPWTPSDLSLLLETYLLKGNKWKEIAADFPGRTDNCIKNKFFSVVRKSLRTSLKILARYEKDFDCGNSVCSTEVISSIKTRVLGDILKERVDRKYTVVDFVKKYGEENYEEEEADKKELERVKKIWEIIEKKKEEYESKSKVKKQKKRKRRRRKKVSDKETKEDSIVPRRNVKISKRKKEDKQKVIGLLNSNEQSFQGLARKLSFNNLCFQINQFCSTDLRDGNLLSSPQKVMPNNFNISHTSQLKLNQNNLVGSNRSLKLEEITSSSNELLMSREEFNRQLSSIQNSNGNSFSFGGNIKLKSKAPVYQFITTFSNKNTNCDMSLEVGVRNNGKKSTESFW